MKEQWKAALAGAVIGVGGVVAGIPLAGQPAEAQAGGYRECFFAYQEGVDIDDHGVVATPDANRRITVPSGYDVVGGAGTGRNVPAILFCRR